MDIVDLDLFLFGLVWLFVAAVLQVRALLPAQVLAWCFGPLLLQVYAAALVTRLPEFKSSSALQLLTVSLVAAATANAYRFAASGGASPLPGEALLAGSVVMALPAIVMVHVALMLSFQRSL